MPEVNGDYAKVTVHQALTGWPDQKTVWGVRVIDAESPLSNADGNAIMTRFATFYAGIQDRLSTSWSVEKFSITDFNTPTTPTWEINGANVGTDAGDLLPPDTAACLSLRTGLRGKSFRGRVFVGGLTEASCTAGGEILPATAADLEANLVQLIANLQADGFPLSIVSTQFNLEPRAAAVVTPVTGGSVNAIFDRQKRRARR